MEKQKRTVCWDGLPSRLSFVCPVCLSCLSVAQLDASHHARLCGESHCHSHCYPPPPVDWHGCKRLLAVMWVSLLQTAFFIKPYGESCWRDQYGRPMECMNVCGYGDCYQWAEGLWVHGSLLVVGYHSCYWWLWLLLSLLLDAAGWAWHLSVLRVRLQNLYAVLLNIRRCEFLSRINPTAMLCMGVFP